MSICTRAVNHAPQRAPNLSVQSKNTTFGDLCNIDKRYEWGCMVLFGINIAKDKTTPQYE